MNRLKRDKLQMLHAVTLLVLISISAYSTSSVMYSFLHENKNTVATVMTNNNILTFAKYLTVRLRLFNRSINPDTWNFNKSIEDHFFPSSDYKPVDTCYPANRIKRRQREDPDFMEKILSSAKLENTPLEAMLDIPFLTEAISTFDTAFMMMLAPEQVAEEIESQKKAAAFLKNITSSSTAHANDIYWLPHSHSYEAPFIEALDKFIEDPQSDILVEKVLAHIVKDNFVRLYSFTFPNITHLPVEFFIDELKTTGLQLTIPLDFLSNINDPNQLFGVMPITNATIKLWSLSYEYNSYVSPFAEKKFSGLVNTDHPLQLFRNIFENDAIYNSTSVREKSDCQMCEGTVTIEQCQFKCRIELIVDQCRCIPFSYRRLFHRDSKRNGLPRCTIKATASCLLGLIGHLGPQCARERTVPCEMQKNSLSGRLFDFSTVTAMSTQAGNAATLTRGHGNHLLYFSLTCEQSAYILFEQKQQNTWIEMLGQVGGNLGIFLSFSLYGVWQVVAFAYMTHKRRKEKQKAKLSDYSGFGIVAPWLRLAQLNMEMESAPNKTGENKDLEKRVEEMESRNQEFENEKLILNDRIAKLEQLIKSKFPSSEELHCVVSV